jgi:hypothetical protein
MDSGTVVALVAVLTLVLNVCLTLYNGGWNLSSKLADMEKRLSIAIAAVKTDLEERLDKAAREHGEALAALRQKIHEVEMWTRDTFVRRDSFLAVVNEVKAGFSELGKRIEARLERMEEKIDSKT